MANAPIPTLPVATSLDGTEQMEIVQPAGSGGTTKRATVGQVAALAATGGSPPAASFILATQNTGLANSRVLAVDTGDIVYTDSGAGGTATIGPINTAAVTYAKFQQVAALSVVGQVANAAGVAGAITGTTDQVLRVAPSGTSLGFGQINLSATSAVTGYLATSYITGSFGTASFTGIWPVSLGGTGTGTLTANGVLVGNGTSSIIIAAANTAGYILTDNGTASPPSFQAPGGLAQQAGLSVLGVSTTATATPSAITGTTDQVLRVGANGTSLAFGQINLSATSAVTGFLATSYITGTFASSKFSGIVSVPNGGTGTSTLTANGVLFGNGTSSVGVTSSGSAEQIFKVNANGTTLGFGQLNLSSTSAVTGVLGAAYGGFGINVSATSGVPAFSTGVPTFYPTTGTGSVVFSNTPTLGTPIVSGALGLTGTSGGQITFPATQNPSADPNTLDDYEEGTFTPILNFSNGSSGITYTTQNGKYTKIGNMVALAIDVVLSNKGSSTGNASIVGLPFTNSAVQVALNFQGNNYAAAATSSLLASLAASGTSIAIGKYATGVITILTDADFNNNSSIRIAGTYLT